MWQLRVTTATASSVIDASSNYNRTAEDYRDSYSYPGQKDEPIAELIQLLVKEAPSVDDLMTSTLLRFNPAAFLMKPQRVWFCLLPSIPLNRN